MDTPVSDTATIPQTEKSDYFLQKASEIRDRPAIQVLLEKALSGSGLPAQPDEAVRALMEKSPFRPNQVETLLNQSQDLLHRIQSEIDTYNDLRARAVDTAAETAAELAELELIEARIAAGDHRLLSLSERGENEALKRYLTVPTEEEPAEGNWTRLLWRMGQAQKLSGENTVGEHSWVIERFKEKLDLRLKSETTVAIDSRVRLADLDAVRFESTAAYLRKTADLKYAAMLRGGPWDFVGRFESMETQIVGDWIDVQARLEASESGLGTFFGYGKSERDLPLPPRRIRTVGGMVTWVRAAVAWLIRFSQQDIAVTELISLRSITGTQWSAALAELTAKRECTLEFRWDGAHLTEYDFIRLVGISTIAKGFPGRLQARLELPGEAMVLQPSGRVSVKQTLPEYFFGRIDDASVRPPEVIGTVSLRNVSPISELPWKITLFAGTPLKAGDWTKTCDVLLELGANVSPR